MQYQIPFFIHQDERHRDRPGGGGCFAPQPEEGKEETDEPGAVCRSERIAQCNRPLGIEAEPGRAAIFGT